MSTAIKGGVLVLAILAVCRPCRADKLYLTNGQVRTGKVIKRDAGGIDFREVKLEGKLEFTNHYPAADVQKVEMGDESESPAGEGNAPATSAPSSEPAGSPVSHAVKTIEDKKAALAETVKKIKDGKLDLVVGVTEVARLVRMCKPDELAELNEQNLKDTGQPLDEYLAARRLEASIKKANTGTWRRIEVTEYERKAMVVELARAIEGRRAEKVAGTTIDNEIEDPNKYQGEPKDAKEFGKHITVTLKMVEDYVRIDKDKTGAAKGKSGKDSHSTKKPADAADEKEKSGDEASNTKEGASDKPFDDPRGFEKKLVALQKFVRQAAVGAQRTRPPTGQGNGNRNRGQGEGDQGPQDRR